MKHPLVVRDELREFIRHLPPALKGKVRNVLEEIVEHPLCGKLLRDELSGLRSYRIGSMRIAYRVHERVVALVTLGPRKTVYQQAALELKRQVETKQKGI